MSQQTRTTDCVCVEAAAGYSHASWCPALTGVPVCEDCGFVGYGSCRCPESSEIGGQVSL